MAQQKSDEQVKPSPASAAYEIHLSAAAEAAYLSYYDLARKAIERGDATNAHCTTLRQIDEAIESLIPHDPFNSRYALAGDLKPIYRLRKGRLRICWIGSPEKRIIFVIFISETLRKAGAANDPYKILTKMVKDGTCNEFFKQIGIKPPPIAPSYMIQ
jgi:mRNA-degrading endonuclease RelE of RelBE toxin-antitoxin system